MTMSSNPCPVCKQTDPAFFKIYFDGFLKLYECKKCGLVAQYPGPGIYGSVNYEDCYSLDFLKKNQEFMYPEREKVFTDTANRIKKNMNTGKLLDVGCGDGHFLSICKKTGFEVHGIEPDHLLSGYAAKKTKADVIQSFYKKELFSAESFDVITFIQTLEHFPDPFSAVQTAAYHLRKGGVIVIEVPSIWAPHFLLYNIFGLKKSISNSYGVMKEHISYFSPKSMRFLTEFAGFKEDNLITGRWSVKYSGILAAVSKFSDALLNKAGIGGILYMGKKE